MALLFLESFDYYDRDSPNVSLTQGRWLASDGAAFSTASRTGDLCVQLAAAGNIDGRLWKSVEDKSTLIVGFGFFPNYNEPRVEDFLVLSYDDGSGTETVQLRLETNLLNGINIKRGSTTLESTSPEVIQLTEWNFVEFKFTINDTTGSYELRVNGNSVASASGVDTQNHASIDYINLFILEYESATSTGQHRFDDLYILDDTGSSLNDFLGEIRVETLAPNADGTTNQWTAVGSTDNYLTVDDGETDFDATYIVTGTTGNKDQFAIETISTAADTVYAVTILAHARREEAGTKRIRLHGRNSTGTESNSTVFYPQISYSYHTFNMENAPGSTGWTTTQINNLEIGIEHYSS